MRIVIETEESTSSKTSIQMPNYEDVANKKDGGSPSEALVKAIATNSPAMLDTSEATDVINANQASEWMNESGTNSTTMYMTSEDNNAGAAPN